VTPFSLTTVDHETIYAWHVLPLPLYSKHETELAAQPSGFVSDIEQTLNFKLIKEDPNARLVLYCRSVVCLDLRVVLLT
jgi:hypothetical protein